jgi:hypothetical protein
MCPVYRLEGVEKRKGTSIVKDESRLFKSVKKFIKEVKIAKGYIWRIRVRYR